MMMSVGSVPVAMSVAELGSDCSDEEAVRHIFRVGLIFPVNLHSLSVSLQITLNVFFLFFFS